MLETIQDFYQMGLYSKDDVNACVPFWITQAQADQITGTTATTTTTTTK